MLETITTPHLSDIPNTDVDASSREIEWDKSESTHRNQIIPVVHSQQKHSSRKYSTVPGKYNVSCAGWIRYIFDITCIKWCQSLHSWFFGDVSHTRHTTNKISTSKYTIWSFIPKSLFYQFSRFCKSNLLKIVEMVM